ncbi:S9 family peptidase [Parerythrobacter jejuensis]|uniref:Prolyl oligopeptidase family serine peptidase n=1 Tax=Parerythrobacter jejuensis TaxID=795812 RepID=A0A845AU45_9SPHN|nr:S9 family peptidase [Parerythrobacter jejuensis]MXP30358.1 prolyl oligopeptidase family serine peptidase [Parerythrobacter jejuensis]MXP33118.1 prolyl oligopeptidase family serine peptidase [Parerythrobacter jejuensis]
MKTLRTALLTATLMFPAAALARPMTAEDVAKLESVGAIAVSPDGSRVAYTTAGLPDVTEGEKDGTTKQELKVAWGPDSWRTYLPKDVSASGITFSPDGGMISYVWADEDEKRAVWGIPIDGGAPKKLAEVEESNVRSHDWSPDGGTIYMLVSAAEDKQRKGENKAGFNAIVYEEEAQLNRLFAASVGSSVDTDPREISVPGYVSSFDIAPDGATGIIETAPTPNVDDSYTSKRVNIIDVASGNVKAVVETPGKIGDVEIAPDGSKLSLIAGVDMNDPAATTLHFVDMATGAITPVNAGAAEAAVDTEFLSDGRLAAVIHKGASSFVRFYNADGSAAGEQAAGDLAISGIDAGGDRIVVRASTATNPSELYVWENDSFTRWTNHNTWLADIDFGKQSVITYTARDGQEVEGVLIEPVGGAPAGGAPLIMNVHGGPEAHESNGWVTAYSKPGQVAAGQGYAVFLPNYRGSTGYGVAFAKQHQADYAGKEFNDIVDAKRFLVSEGIADPDRTGITGGSYGGYASAWGATALSAEYAAAVMFVGISNQISKFGTTDIPYEMYNVHSRKWPWEDWQGMLEVSPIFHVDKATTPILIMHGEEDTRVDPSQSYELYRAIKVRKPDTRTRMVLYPGEPHGNRRAASRYDYNLRMMRWFDTYLKTGDRSAPLPPSRPDLGLEDDSSED